MTETKAVAVPGGTGLQFTPQQVDLLKRTIAKDHTNDELELFVNFCKAKKLDPFSREVYSVKRKDKLSFQMSIDTFRAKADETGEKDGQEEFWCGQDGVWVDLWTKIDPPYAAKVMVYRKGCAKPFTGIAKWSEYKPVPGNDFLWNKMPSLMLAKVAEALALRKAFPAKLGGIYAPEEMAQAANPISRGIMPTSPAPVPAEAEVVEKTEEPIPFGEDAPTDAAAVQKVFGGTVRQETQDEPPPEAPPAPAATEEALPVISEKQGKFLYAKWKSAGIPDSVAKAFIKDNFGHSYSGKMTKPQLDKMLEWIEKYAEVSK